MSDIASPIEGLRIPTLAEEVEDYRGLSPEEKAVLLRAAVRTGVRLLAANPHRERVLAHRDTWSPSAVAILRGTRPSR